MPRGRPRTVIGPRTLKQQQKIDAVKIQKVIKDVKVLKKKSSVQYVSYETTATVAVTTAGVITYMYPNLANTNVCNEQGDTLVNKIHFNFTTANGNAANNFCRVILFHDRQNDGALPTVADVLENADVASQYAVESADRFKIIKDWKLTTGLYNNLSQLKTFMKSYKTPLKMTFSGSTQDVTTAEFNQIFMLVIASSVTTSYNLTYFARATANKL